MCKLMIVTSLILLGSAATGKAGIINGDFQTGDLTGWTTFNTPNGGTDFDDVVLYDVAGTGTPSLSARLEVGETSGPIGGGGLGEGAGIQQAVVTGAGTLTISANIATEGGNADTGTFELLLNGKVVSTYAFGGASGSSSLSYSGSVAAGSNVIAIDARRGYGIGFENTPFQYIDNVVLGGNAVPEPSTLALLVAGAVGLLGIGLRRRRNRMLRGLLAVTLVTSAASVQANEFNMPSGQTSLQFVTVGDPGNVADPATGSLYGAVPYSYNIGKYDV